MNDKQWANGSVCGMCLKYRAIGGDPPNRGTVGPSSNWTYAAVCDRCPECQYGDLDLATGLDGTGDGRWYIEWLPVQCNVGDSTFKYYTTTTSNQWFAKIKVSNGRWGHQACEHNQLSMIS